MTAKLAIKEALGVIDYAAHFLFIVNSTSQTQTLHLLQIDWIFVFSNFSSQVGSALFLYFLKLYVLFC